jgi:formylglycine-generating enzyme required for sulfatase activity
MVPVRAGTFRMGSKEDPSEKPVHRVAVASFLMGKYPVTVGEWSECVAAQACTATMGGDAQAPVSNVSWTDAEAFVAWLSKVTHKAYRLPTEAEWEYAARAGTETPYWWGDTVKAGMADCKGCGGAYDPQHPAKVGSFAPNSFGLYDMAGGVAQWVADCWHSNYAGAPTDSSAWNAPDCREHVLRGGSWKDDPSYLRSASREYYDSDVRYYTHGFRVARSP